VTDAGLWSRSFRPRFRDTAAPASARRACGEGRQRQQREDRRGHQPADHHDRERALDLGAVDPEHEQREQAEDRRRGGHDLGPDAADAGLAQRAGERPALGEQRARLGDEHEPVLHRDPESPISPTSDDTLQLSPAITSARMPPTNAFGRVARITPVRPPQRQPGPPGRDRLGMLGVREVALGVEHAQLGARRRQASAAVGVQSGFDREPRAYHRSRARRGPLAASSPPLAASHPYRARRSTNLAVHDGHDHRGHLPVIDVVPMAAQRCCPSSARAVRSPAEIQEERHR
jgi:hypothetical protein